MIGMNAITDHRSQITDHRSQITDHRSQITDHRSQITDHRSQITDHADYVIGRVFCQALKQTFSHFCEEVFSVVYESEGLV